MYGQIRSKLFNTDGIPVKTLDLQINVQTAKKIAKITQHAKN